MEQLDLPHREGDPDRLLVSQESAQRQRLLSAVHQRRVQDEVGEGSLQLVGKPELRDGLGVVASHPLHRAKARPEMKPQPASPFVYHFLGKVNKFAGRIVRGRFRVGSAL